MKAQTWQAYIRRIRNPRKRVYAQEYALYLLHGGQIEPDYGTLSYMAAQGVRMQLGEILREATA